MDHSKPAAAERSGPSGSFNIGRSAAHGVNGANIGAERVFTLCLPRELFDELTARARAEDRRLAQTFRTALRAYLDGSPRG